MEENSSNDINMSQKLEGQSMYGTTTRTFFPAVRSSNELPSKNNISDDFCQFYSISLRYTPLCLPVLPRINLLCLPISPNYTILGLPGIYFISYSCQDEILQIYIFSDKQEFEHSSDYENA